MPIEPNELADIAAILAEQGVTGEPAARARFPKGDPRNDLRRALLELMAKVEATSELSTLVQKIMPTLPKPPDILTDGPQAMEAWYDRTLALAQKAAKPIADRLNAKVDALLAPGGKDLDYDAMMKVVLKETKRLMDGEFENMLADKVYEPDDNTARLMLANMISGRVMREEIRQLQLREETKTPGKGLENAAKILNAPHRVLSGDDADRQVQKTAPGKMRMRGPLTESWLEDALRGPNPATQFNAMLFAGANPNLPENDDLFKQVASLPLKSVKQIVNKGDDALNRGILPLEGRSLEGTDRRANPMKLELSQPNASGDPEQPVGETPLLQAIRAEFNGTNRLFIPSETSLILGITPPEEQINPFRNPERTADIRMPGAMAGRLLGATRNQDNAPEKISEPQAYLIESLLQAGAYPDTVDGEQVNPLRSAALSNDGDLAKLLIRYRADVNYVYREIPQPNEDGTINLPFEETPLTVALTHYQPAYKETERREVLNLADGKSGLKKVDEEYLAKTKAGEKTDAVNVEAWKRLVTDEDRKRELQPSVAEILIDAGADMNWRDPEGRTPIMKLLEEPRDNRMDMVEMLVRKAREKGIDVLEVRDNNGRTVLHRVVYIVTSGDWDTAMQLINLGASPLFDMAGTSTDDEGNETPYKISFIDHVRDIGKYNPQPLVFLAAKGLVTLGDCLEALKQNAALGGEEDTLDAAAAKILSETADNLYSRKLLTAEEAESLGATQPAKDRLEKMERDMNIPSVRPTPEKPAIPNEIPKSQTLPGQTPSVPVTPDPEPVPTDGDGPGKYDYREATLQELNAPVSLSMARSGNSRTA